MCVAFGHIVRLGPRVRGDDMAEGRFVRFRYVVRLGPRVRGDDMAGGQCVAFGHVVSLGPRVRGDDKCRRDASDTRDSVAPTGLRRDVLVVRSP